MTIRTIQTAHATYPVEAGIFETINKAKDLGKKAKDAVVKDLKDSAEHISHNLKITKEQVLLAYDEPKMANILKATGYSFATAFGAFHLAHKVAKEGALHTLAFLGEHHILHKLGHKASHKGGHSVDKVLAKYPVLKKLTGPALAGIILYGYTMTEPHKLGDWDLSSVKKAFAGEYGIADFLQSAECVALSAHVVSGKALSLMALAENVTTLAAGLTCTAIIHSKHPKLAGLGKGLQEAFSAFKPKKSALEDLGASEESLKKAFGGKVPDFGKPAPEKDGGKDEPADDPKKDDPKKEEPSKDKEPGGTWWSNMPPESKKQYLSEHPNSQLKANMPLTTINARLSNPPATAAIEFSPDSALATIERIESQCKRARSLLARPRVTPQLVFIILENISSEALRAVD